MTDHSVLRAGLRLSGDTRIALALGDRNIFYRGDAACPYGRQSTKRREPFAAIVLHHNLPHRSLQGLISYQIAGDTKRGGHFGYHFYISQDGQIVQGAPLSVRTNHIKGLGYRARKPFGEIAQNRNAIGVTCVGAERSDGSEPTESQISCSVDLVQALCGAFDISPENVFGHGEIQSDRHPAEGTHIAKLIRSQGKDRR